MKDLYTLLTNNKFLPPLPIPLTLFSLTGSGIPLHPVPILDLPNTVPPPPRWPKDPKPPVT